MADRTQDADWIAAVISNVLASNGGATLLQIEIAFRDRAAQSYLVAGPGKFQVVTGGMPEMLAALTEAGLTPEANRAALAGINPHRGATG